jgi:integrase/recombinase XerC
LDSAKVQKLVECFLTGRSQNTIDSYRVDLERFQHFLKLADLPAVAGSLIGLPPGEANALVLEFRNSLLAAGLQPSTINRRIAAIRSLVKLARTLGLVTWAIEIPKLRVESYRDTRGPGRGAIHEMLQILEKGRSTKEVRDYALLRLLFDLALRASEVVSLDLTDIDLAGNRIAILGKGQSQKSYFAMPKETSEAVSAWIAVRVSRDAPLFYNLDHSRMQKRLTRSGLYRIVRKLGLEVGVRTRPHGIRHTSITQAIKVAQLNGITLPEVRQFSRHASLQTLQIYADRERNLFGRIATLVSQSAPRAEETENGTGDMNQNGNEDEK